MYKRIIALLIIMVVSIVPSLAQETTENIISLAHHSNVECTASINGVSTKGLVAESSGVSLAQGAVCHVGVDEAVEIALTALTDPKTITIQGLKNDSIATFYDANGYIIGTYTAATGYVTEIPYLEVLSITITNIENLLVVNGSFESELLTENTVVNMNNPNQIDGWEIVSGNLDWFRNVQAADGVGTVDLSGSEKGSIRQLINTVVGQPYVLRFALSGDPNGGLPEKVMTATAGNVTETFTYILSPENSIDNMLWQYHSLEFIAESETTEIVFTSLTEGWYGPVIDNVSVREGAVCSPETEEQVELTFVNHLQEQISFHWMRFDCTEGEGPVLAPTVSEDGITYDGHIYRIRGEDGRIIGLYVASVNNSVVTIGNQ
jgi:choice-of-anchor C domain-containing protein